MKKTCTILATLFAFTLLPIGVNAENDDYYDKDENKSWVTVSGVENGKILFDFDDGEVVDVEETITKFHLPKEINGVVVDDLASRLFEKSENLTSVSIPGTVEEIPMAAFAHCSNLTSVTLEEGVEEISISAFYNTPSLKTVNLPSTLDDIGNTAFGLTGVEDFVIPNGVDELGDMVFYGSKSMKTLTIPASVTEIGDNLVWQNSKLTDIYYGGTAEMWKAIEIDSENGQLYQATLHNVDGDEFTSDITGEGQTGWITVEGIDNARILYDSKNGKILEVESTVTKAHIPRVINGTKVTEIANGLFSEKDELKSVVVPGTIEKIPLGAFANCGDLEYIAIEEGVLEIQTSAFYGAEDLETLILPNSLKTIGNTAFGLMGVEELTIPEGVETIGELAFYGSDDLEIVSLPSTLKSISHKILWQCSEIEVINYNGTEAMWNAISIDSNNKELLNADIKLSDGSIIKTDVNELAGNPSSWADKEIAEADKVGLVIILSDVPKFTDDITREQFAEVIVNMVEISTGKEIVAKQNPFTDTNNEDVVKAYSIGVITGTSATTFNPEGKTNREQIATMIYRAAMYIAENGGANIFTIPSDDIDDFDDGDDVSDWAKDAVTALSANGIMEGTSEKSLSPKNEATVEQSILLIYRMFTLA